MVTPHPHQNRADALRLITVSGRSHEVRPEVAEFIREVLEYRPAAVSEETRVWLPLLDALGGTILKEHVSGSVLDVIYAASVYAVRPEALAQTGHDSAAVRAFVELADQTRQAMEQEQAGEDRVREIRERVLAGQAIVSTLTDEGEEPGSKGAHNAVTSGNFLDDSEKVLAKLRAEEDTDPLSRDWAKAPKGARTVYRRIMERFASGTETTVDERFLDEVDPAQACRQWLVANPFLLAVVDGVFIPLGDRQSEKAQDIAYFNGVKVNLANYPGIGEGVNPLVGRNWKTEELDALYERINLEIVRAGGRPSTAQVVRIINERFRGDRKAVSCTSARKAKKRLLDSGRLVEVKAARHYRDNHAWRTVPALLGAPEDHPELVATLDTTEAVSAYVGERLRLHREEYRAVAA